VTHDGGCFGEKRDILVTRGVEDVRSEYFEFKMPGATPENAFLRGASENGLIAHREGRTLDLYLKTRSVALEVHKKGAN
jgi:hypothetical protein